MIPKDHLIYFLVLLAQANVLVIVDMVGLNVTHVMSTTIQVLDHVLVNNLFFHFDKY